MRFGSWAPGLAPIYRMLPAPCAAHHLAEPQPGLVTVLQSPEFHVLLPAPPTRRDEPSTGQHCLGPSSCLILPVCFLQAWQDQSAPELLLGARDAFLHGWSLKALIMMKGGPVCPKRGMGQRNCDEVLMNLANLQKSLIKHLMSHHFFSLENTTPAKDLMFPLI